LDTPLQGWSRPLADWLSARFPGFMSMKLLGVGSAYAEQCHVGARPDLSPAAARAAFQCLARTVEAHAASCGALLIAFKDMAPARDRQFSPALTQAGFVLLRSLPVASLDLAHADFDAYMGRLSAATRKDLLRMLKAGRDVRIEHRSTLDGLEARVAELYESTRRRSQVRYGDFEELPVDYFGEISRNGQDRAHFVLYWAGEQLIAFNLLLLQADRVIDKFLGCQYPLAAEKNIYALSWLENVRFAIGNGYPKLQSGQTAYALKVRYGSELMPSLIYAKHRRPWLNGILRLCAAWLDFGRWDPDLRALARTAKKRQIATPPAQRRDEHLREPVEQA
ncbi:MAG: hypothetical protein JWO28_11, partial [Hyphomicrobiales bacterium]|nr:hypothetical protein [Hyphomicrobiales bacterium]